MPNQAPTIRRQLIQSSHSRVRELNVGVCMSSVKRKSLLVSRYHRNWRMRNNRIGTDLVLCYEDFDLAFRHRNKPFNQLFRCDSPWKILHQAHWIPFVQLETVPGIHQRSIDNGPVLEPLHQRAFLQPLDSGNEVLIEEALHLNVLDELSCRHDGLFPSSEELESGFQWPYVGSWSLVAILLFSRWCVRPRSPVALAPVVVFCELRTILFRAREVHKLEDREARNLVVKAKKRTIYSQNIVRLDVAVQDCNLLTVVDEVERFVHVSKQFPQSMFWYELRRAYEVLKVSYNVSERATLVEDSRTMQFPCVISSKLVHDRWVLA